MSQIQPFTFPQYGDDHWNTIYESILNAIRNAHNSTDALVGTKVSDEELADALAAQLASIRQLPAPGSDGQVLAIVAGTPEYVDLPGGGTGGDYPPVGGIPKTDLSSSVQTSLNKADSALQSIPSNVTTDDELAAAIQGVTLASLGAQPAGSYATLTSGRIPAAQMPLDPNSYGAAKSADLDNVFTVASAAIPSSQKAAANGVATLGSDGKLVAGQLPAIGIVDFLGHVASQAAMLALTGQKGDWAIRDDLGTVWIITGADPSVLSGWTQISYPSAPVTSVFGRTGAVTATKSDVGLGNVDNTADASKPVSTAQQAALDTKAALSHTHTASQISDSTTIGRALLTAATVTAARNAQNIYDIALGGSVAGLPEGSLIFEAAS